MIGYIVRRLGVLLIILLGSSFLLFNLTAISSDPLENLRISKDENAKFQIAALTRALSLDVPPPLRYFLWLKGVLGYLIGQGTLGLTREGGTVVEQVSQAIPVSIRLVFVATIVAIIMGISLGIISALRQYSRFDYSMTFAAFLMFSLPIFWVAVLLKQFLAIEFNDFLETPKISLTYMVIVSILSGVFWSGVLSLLNKRALITFSLASSLTFGSFLLINYLDWLEKPRLGLIGLAILGSAFAVAITAISVGIEDKRILKASFVAVGVGLASYYPVQFAFKLPYPNIVLLSLAVLTFMVAAAIGWLMGGEDKGPAIRTVTIVSVIFGILTILDRLMQVWPRYVSLSDVNYRPIPTIGESRIWFEPVSFWIRLLDSLTHLILPTLALTLISFAGYIRFSRGTLLEVLNQDYIRTARSKGLTERTVIMRHAFRNTMIPMTTILVVDFAGVIGGAIITERVFGWRGMGTLFNNAITNMDLNLLMGVFLVTGTLAVLANLIADLLYSVMDPRVRVGAGK